MKNLLILVLCVVSASCSSRIVVTKIAENPGTLDAPSAYYALPKARISITVPYTKRTYKPGELEVYFEDYKDEFDLKSKKPNDWGYCAKQSRVGDDPQTRYRFNAIEKLTTSALPDDTNIYAVRMRADPLQDVKVGLELTPDLIVGAASGSSTSVSSTIADVVVATLSRDISRDEPPETDDETNSISQMRVNRASVRDRVVAELRTLKGRRDQILLRSAGTQDAEAILSRIEARQKKLKRAFEGTYSEKEDAVAIVWIPPAHSADTHATLCCKVADANRCELKRGNSATPQLQCATHSNCSSPPDDSLFVMAVEDTAAFGIRDRLRRADNLRNSDVDEQGFAYRIPAIAAITVQQKVGNQLTTFGEFDTYIAQFGDVFRLPADVGTGKTEFTITYHPELGALKTLSASGVGMGTDSLTEAALDVLEPEDELSELERRYKILDFEEKIRELEERLPDTDSDTANP